MFGLFLTIGLIIPAIFGVNFGINHGRLRKQEWCERENNAYEEAILAGGSDLSLELYSKAVMRCFERAGFAFFDTKDNTFFDTKDNTLIFRPPREDRITSCLNAFFYFSAFGHAYLCFLISRHYASDEIGGSEYNIQFDLEKKLIRRLWIGGGGFVAGDAWGKGIEDDT